MVPIVFLGINTSTLSPFSASAFTSPVLRTFPVVYVFTVVVRAGLLATPGGAKIHQDFSRAIDVAQVTNLLLSLLTNVLATSIIATKTWYVGGVLKLSTAPSG